MKINVLFEFLFVLQPSTDSTKIKHSYQTIKMRLDGFGTSELLVG